MAEPLKYIYNEEFLNNFARAVAQVVKGFRPRKYVQEVFSEAWDEKELKDRMRHMAVTLHAHLTEDYEKNSAILIGIVKQLQKNGVKENSFEFMFIPDYIEVYGQAYFDASITAMEYITQFTSCEFAVRPFILKYEEAMVGKMWQWAQHPHQMVRRLASEGSRPRLPWAMAIPNFKRDPGPIIPILESLKNDESETVRRSVANNLNDIAKDNPVTVIELVQQWKGQTPNTDWVVKHGSRTLLKQGNPEIMQIFGFSNSDDVSIDHLKVQTPVVAVGEDLVFSFELVNQKSENCLVRLEYGIYFMKANGTLSRKVFKISEREYLGASRTQITRNQPFKRITTRKLYAGLHQVAIIVNGHEVAKAEFELTE